jgi:hypothetical protein
VRGQLSLAAESVMIFPLQLTGVTTELAAARLAAAQPYLSTVRNVSSPPVSSTPGWLIRNTG